MSEHNPNSRLETFCDGVFAIAITLLIVDIKIPSTEQITDTNSFWLALKHIAPSILAFILSFIIILITWVNHHNSFLLINKTSSIFIYANGFLLLTVVFVPFPTSLLGEHLFTRLSTPAVVLYDGTLALQAIGWLVLSTAVLKKQLFKNERSKTAIIANRRFGYFALILYSVCAIVAFWLPLTIAIITIISWAIWLIWGILLRQGEN